MDERSCPAKPLPVDFARLPLLGQDGDGVFFHANDNGRLQATNTGNAGDLLLDLFVGQPRKIQALFGTAIAMTAVVIQKPLADGALGGRLLFAVEGEVDSVAVFVSCFSETPDHFLASHL